MSSSDRPGKDERARRGRAPSPTDPVEPEAQSAAGESPAGPEPADAVGSDPAAREGAQRTDSTIEGIDDPNSEESRIANEFLKKWKSANGLADAPFDFEGKGGPRTVSPAEPLEAAEAAEEGPRRKRKGGLLERLQGEHLRQAEARAHQLEEEIRSLEEKLRAQEALVQKHYEARLRVQADLENHKKRVAREKEEIIQYGAEKLIKDLLPFVDNLERALDHARKANESGPVVEGVKITLNQLVGALKRHGIEPFESTGEPFDPQRHEAMSQVEATDVAPNTVMEQFQRGYLLWKRLLRPAMVSVSKAPVPRQSLPSTSFPPAEMIELPAPESGVVVAGTGTSPDQEKKTERIPFAGATGRPAGSEEKSAPPAPPSEPEAGGKAGEARGAEGSAGQADPDATERPS